MPLVRNMFSISLTTTVQLPSGLRRMVLSTGSKVLGRWCWGQLNSMPPLIQGPARPTSAGLMTWL